MGKRIVTGVVLLFVFVAALVGFSMVLNQGTADMTADMGQAELPVISFEESGYEVNNLSGYTAEMNITAMRDTLLPISVGTSVKANISGYLGKIDSLTYEVFSLDGIKSYKKASVKDVKDTVNLELGESISDGSEKVLRIILELDGDTSVYYYMRVVRAAEFNVQQCLEFAESFHNRAMSADDLNELKTHMMMENAAEGNGLQRVTPASGMERIGWGNLAPQMAGDIRWEIKESNGTYTSVLLKYQVNCKNDSGTEDLYNVREFFKVRFLKGEASLEDYERTMNQVFSGTQKDFDKKGIVLGTAEEDVEFLANDSGESISFVQEREVWNYNRKGNKISLVFSFAEAENNDLRNLNDNHWVRLLDMDKQGNTTFAVYGYMNRGVHEGQVGAAIYYFNIADNYVEEKAFIPSRNSGEIAWRNLNQLIYYSRPRNMLYAMLEGTLYQIDLESQDKVVLAEKLETGQYAASEDGTHIAYQLESAVTQSASLEVWNFDSGESYTVTAGSDEIIRPLGFVQGDAVYGIGKKADVGKTTSGQSVIPLYKLEIRNSKNEVAKSYQSEGVYIIDAMIEGNMITMNRVQKSGAAYVNTSQDYITNNKEEKEQSVETETFTSDTKGRQVRLKVSGGIDDSNPKLLKPKQMLLEKPATIAFEQKEASAGYYVYGHGRLQGIYDRAGTAIQAADGVRGVVVTADQTKLWERGNRQLRYSLEGASAFSVNEGESSVAACLRQALVYEGKNVDAAGGLAGGKSVFDILNDYSGGEAVDLTGCTMEQLCYIIGKGTPVIAMTGGDSAILLVGYDDATFTYINPETGRKPTEIIRVVEERTTGSQGTFIGYVK